MLLQKFEIRIRIRFPLAQRPKTHGEKDEEMVSRLSSATIIAKSVTRF